MELAIYTRQACHLCEEMKLELAPLVEEFGLTLREINIDADAELAARFGEEVPVLFLDGRKVAKYRVDLKQLRRQLEKQKRRNS